MEHFAKNEKISALLKKVHLLGIPNPPRAVHQTHAEVNKIASLCIKHTADIPKGWMRAPGGPRSTLPIFIPSFTPAELYQPFDAMDEDKVSNYGTVWFRSRLALPSGRSLHEANYLVSTHCVFHTAECLTLQQQKLQAIAKSDKPTWLPEWKRFNAGWLRVTVAKAIPKAPASTKNVQLGAICIKVDGKAAVRKGKNSVVGERLKLTWVGTVHALCKINLKEHMVLVWHENVRLLNDKDFFQVQPALRKGKA